jgi:hypothetical protein
MLRNYFTTALRNVLRSPFFSSINLLGMVLGITCSSLILLFAWDELHYDQYHTNAKNIYRITTQQEKATTIGAVMERGVQNERCVVRRKSNLFCG